MCVRPAVYLSVMPSVVGRVSFCTYPHMCAAVCVPLYVVCICTPAVPLCDGLPSATLCVLACVSCLVPTVSLSVCQYEGLYCASSVCSGYVPVYCGTACQRLPSGRVAVWPYLPDGSSHTPPCCRPLACPSVGVGQHTCCFRHKSL